MAALEGTYLAANTAGMAKEPLALNLKLPRYEICARTSFWLSAFAAGQAKRQIRPDGA